MSKANEMTNPVDAVVMCDAITALANNVCKHLPEGYTLSLVMEEGSAYVTLGRDYEGYINLPDSADKTLLEEINDAVKTAYNHTLST